MAAESLALLARSAKESIQATDQPTGQIVDYLARCPGQVALDLVCNGV